MTTGTEKAGYKLVSISFPRCELNPLYATGRTVNEKDIEWFVGWNFSGSPKNRLWDELKVSVSITMRQKGGEGIAFLVTESHYLATSRLAYKHKYMIALRVINETLGHAQGGWVVKNLNTSIGSILPQAYNKAEEDKLVLEKKIYEYWE